ncbi:metallophosphoesterase 1 [Biomphalaria pfeifferi]|uniref:Metallophosphoesterase 1 n=1 Tax=Biomphalaria pfeifferi TaxID=112525 RepID=A0AAD8BBD8_BIOPF|nr:metallophosphoesterase 1 [Biomphalaria pfeifferi]
MSNNAAPHARFINDNMIPLYHAGEAWKKIIVASLSSKILRSILILLLFFIYCEVIHYIVVLLQCTWPSVTHETYSSLEEAPDLKVLVIADTHLLGFRHGHWFDKLRREWQMRQAFQTSMLIHKPDVVFVLGDLLDEGKWCGDEEFNYHVTRFKSMFAVPEGTELHVVSGNHDEGFHEMITEHKHQRFERAFDSPSVRMVDIQGNTFVLINSMAMEGDHCTMCVQAERKVKEISYELALRQKCEKHKDEACKSVRKPYSKPILLQHFPMYRKSDSECNTEDSAPADEKDIPFRPRYDSLDQRSSKLLFSTLEPRLVISAHTHHGCYIVHSNNIPEWSVSSFSWRNRNNPTLLMLRVNSVNHTAFQCFLPKESTVINIYILSGVLAGISLLWPSISYKYRPKIC